MQIPLVKNDSKIKKYTRAVGMDLPVGVESIRYLFWKFSLNLLVF
jgi:hypothetical protein